MKLFYAFLPLAIVAISACALSQAFKESRDSKDVQLAKWGYHRAHGEVIADNDTLYLLSNGEVYQWDGQRVNPNDP